MIVSELARDIIGSEIIKLAAEINEKIKNGEKIYNFTIGDFNPLQFPIPAELKNYIIEEYGNDQTNYPPADGLPELRQAISRLLQRRCQLNYAPDEILVAGGARPVIYTIFRTIVDRDDKVIFATPSWNNNHYTYLNHAGAVVIETLPENDFMPSAADILPHLSSASLLALCSPQNPTGTVFSRQGLEEICHLVLEENKRRGQAQKPLYLMYDQIYWELTYGNTTHYNPVSLCPEMKNYTIFVDGISKSLAATGVRVGWSMGPKFIVDKMKAILTHIGAWAPRAEQAATARFINNLSAYDNFVEIQKSHIHKRLLAFYTGMMQLKAKAYPVDAIEPKAAIYLTVKFDLTGQVKNNGQMLENTKDVTRYLLDEAGLAIVPFYAFGSRENSSWYRLSVGTCSMDDINQVMQKLELALGKLQTEGAESK